MLGAGIGEGSQAGCVRALAQGTVTSLCKIGDGRMRKVCKEEFCKEDFSVDTALEIHLKLFLKEDNTPGQ